MFNNDCERGSRIKMLDEITVTTGEKEPLLRVLTLPITLFLKR